MHDAFQAVRAVLSGLLVAGALVYGVGVHYGWLAGAAIGLGLGFMVALIFGLGRRERRATPLQDIRAKAAKRWVCRTCGTAAPPKSRMCMNCGADFPS